MLIILQNFAKFRELYFRDFGILFEWVFSFRVSCEYQQLVKTTFSKIFTVIPFIDPVILRVENQEKSGYIFFLVSSDVLT